MWGCEALFRRGIALRTVGRSAIPQFSPPEHIIDQCHDEFMVILRPCSIANTSGIFFSKSEVGTMSDMLKHIMYECRTYTDTLRRPRKNHTIFHKHEYTDIVGTIRFWNTFFSTVQA